MTCNEKRQLFRQGADPIGLYILRRGRATLSMESPTGGSLHLMTLYPGSLLGLPALLGSEPYSLTATAEEGAELGFVTREDFNSLLLADPTIAVHVLHVLAAEVHTARHAISEF